MEMSGDSTKSPFSISPERSSWPTGLFNVGEWCW